MLTDRMQRIEYVSDVKPDFSVPTFGQTRCHLPRNRVAGRLSER
jgi:hypothetical protein